MEGPGFWLMVPILSDAAVVVRVAVWPQWSAQTLDNLALRSDDRTVLGKPTPNWRTKRHAEARDDIVAMAWELARENGLAGLSLRDLARRLGMAAASLYSYFDSKHALYDAMFADGYRVFLDLGPIEPGPDLRSTLHSTAQRWVSFALDDPVRNQLLNQRSIPGFEPSAETYELAKQAYELTAAPLRALTEVTQDDLDLISAFIGGLINQQLANDPSGTRWVRLLDDAVDLLAYRIEKGPGTAPPARERHTKKKGKP